MAIPIAIATRATGRVTQPYGKTDMKWSIRIGRLFGIEVYLHFTFLLLLAFLGVMFWQATQDP